MAAGYTRVLKKGSIMEAVYNCMAAFEDNHGVGVPELMPKRFLRNTTGMHFYEGRGYGGEGDNCASSGPGDVHGCGYGDAYGEGCFDYDDGEGCGYGLRDGSDSMLVVVASNAYH